MLKKIKESAEESAAKLEAIRKENIKNNPDKYICEQIVLKEQIFGVASDLKSKAKLQKIINLYDECNYKLEHITTNCVHSTGFDGGDRIVVTLIFKREDK